jgi:superfamily II DNA or RNA helicase
MHVRIDSWAWFDKAELGPAKIWALKKRLTIVPRKTHPKSEPETLYLWHETEHEIGVPREYFEQFARKQHDIEYGVTEGYPLSPVSFEGTLRPAQQQALDQVVPRLQDGRLGGIVKAATGWGKTVWACALIAKMQVPAVIFVHREALLDQWVKELHRFLPGARVGIAQEARCEFEGCHAIVAMMQSVHSRTDYPRAFFAYPGLLIPDEVHRVSAPTFSKIPPLFKAKWRVGISATPRRKDGTENVFLWHIGPLIYSGDQPTLKPLIKRVWTKFRVVATRHFDPSKAGEALLLRFMMANRARNALITRQLVLAVQAGRRVLVMSKRLKHLEILQDLFLAAWTIEWPTDDPYLDHVRDMAEEGSDPEAKGLLRRLIRDRGLIPTVGQCVGGVKGAALDKAKKAQVIFATAQFAAEGFDVPPLDTLFLTMPMADVEQAAGRILREYEDKKEPIIVDFRDDSISLFKFWGVKRDATYARIRA